MKRFIENELIAWLNRSDRKPLIVRGARQVGKTYSILEFGQRHFSEGPTQINLEEHPDWHAIFEPNLEAQRILNELSVVVGRDLFKTKGLIFFDEIQTCPKAIQALRYFYEKYPNLPIVAAGSLLEFQLQDGTSFPMGRVSFLNMFPMTFLEFLWASGETQLADIIASFDLSRMPEVSPAIHQKLLQELKKYFVVGGMPAAIREFCKTGSFQECFAVQQDLVDSLRADFSQYAIRSDTRALDLVLKAVSGRVGQQIKYAQLSEDFSAPTLKKSFDLLCQARWLYRVEAASPAGLPLGASTRAKKFKALLLDISLMHRLSGIPLEEEWGQQNLMSFYQGAMAEQFVGQELLQRHNRELYYWNREERGSSAEVDYLLVRNGEIYPVEVKSGPAGKLKSLHLLLKTFPQCPQGLVLSSAEPASLDDQKIKFIPLYFAGHL